MAEKLPEREATKSPLQELADRLENEAWADTESALKKVALLLRQNDPQAEENADRLRALIKKQDTDGLDYLCNDIIRKTQKFSAYRENKERDLKKYKKAIGDFENIIGEEKAKALQSNPKFQTAVSHFPDDEVRQKIAFYVSLERDDFTQAGIDINDGGFKKALESLKQSAEDLDVPCAVWSGESVSSKISVQTERAVKSAFVDFREDTDTLTKRGDTVSFGDQRVSLRYIPPRTEVTSQDGDLSVTVGNAFIDPQNAEETERARALRSRIGLLGRNIAENEPKAKTLGESLERYALAMPMLEHITFETKIEDLPALAREIAPDENIEDTVQFLKSVCAIKRQIHALEEAKREKAGLEAELREIRGKLRQEQRERVSAWRDKIQTLEAYKFDALPNDEIRWLTERINRDETLRNAVLDNAPASLIPEDWKRGGFHTLEIDGTNHFSVMQKRELLAIMVELLGDSKLIRGDGDTLRLWNPDGTELTDRHIHDVLKSRGVFREDGSFNRDGVIKTLTEQKDRGT